MGISGTAYNEALALWKLGSHVELCVSHAADDPVAAFLTASQPRHPRLRITLGAGDARCAAFIDGCTRGLDPGTALRRAVRYASAKLAHAGGAQGLLSAGELDQPEAPGR
ncbi:MAG TPA: hypothetical protein VGD91_06805 [Trebonia sp.]